MKWKSQLRKKKGQPTPVQTLGQTKDASLGFVLLLAAGTLLSACTNNFSFNGLPANVLTAPEPNSTLTENNTNGGAFTLSRVIKSTLDPNNTLDLIGDGTGAFGSLCLPISGEDAGATALTACKCTFAFNSVINPRQQVDTDVIYHETNLLRCKYSAIIPSDVTSVDVSVHLTSAGTYSNKIKFTFNGTGITSDASDPRSFSKVTRYQCRDIVNIPYLLDGSVYDPFQSIDSHLAYSLDFYATNIGKAIAAYVSAGTCDESSGCWDCPPILTPEVFLSSSSLTQFTNGNNLSMRVYSRAPLDGSKLIYPPQAGSDRATFYLSKEKSGVFRIPVNAYQSPGVITSEGGNNGPLGYGAAPVPLGNGEETCPDTTTIIPTGYHWVKIWLFRAGLDARTFKKSGTAPGIDQLNSITCNPGAFPLAEPAPNPLPSSVPVYQGCAKKTGDNDNRYALIATSSQGYTPISSVCGPNVGDPQQPLVPGCHFLADRLLGSGQCVQLDTMGSSGPNACTPNGSNAGPACIGADFWRFKTIASGCDSPFYSSDPMNVCSLITTPNVPLTKDVGTENYDVASRFDFLFVVSPPNISLRHMLDESPSSPGNPYHPFRFQTDADCNLDDPDNGCSSKYIINNYGLKLHDVGSNGDPPATDPDRAGVFPVCALQPDS